MKFLLIDNYDSFIYNLRYELNALDVEVTVCRNDIDYDEISRLIVNHDAVVISPGPSSPKNAGHCLKLVKDFYKTKPILGICLGHQTIAEALGGLVTKAKQVIHGKSSTISLSNSNLFSGLGISLTVARYHSLIAQELPEKLKAIAKSDNGEVMAIEHNRYPVYGLQFHPESIMSLKGVELLENFKTIVAEYNFNMEKGYVASA